MKKEGQNWLRFAFAFLSLLLMLPELLDNNNAYNGSYYITLVIFLSERVVDLFYDEESEHTLLNLWTLANKILGIIVIIIAFAFLEENFRMQFKDASPCMGKIFFGVAISYTLRVMVEAVILSVKWNLIKKKRKTETSGGENNTREAMS